MLRHELANVINGLTGMAGLLKSSGLKPEQERWLEAIEQSAAQLHFLVRAADETRSLVGRISRFNGVKLLEQAITAHTAAAQAKSLRLLLSIDAELPAYWSGDSRLTRQFLDNLLGNAIKFTESGDVRLSARGDSGKTLALAVSDTGPGVPASERKRIFGIFDRGTSGSGKPGQGLGLPVCRRIVTALGGEIRYAPRTGQGARFQVSLPGTLGSEPESRPLPLAFTGVSCLLDLDPPLARVTGKLLDRLGIDWCKARRNSIAHSDPGLFITISEGCRYPGAPWPGLMLSADSADGGISVALSPPLLESSLEPALLKLALAWRWQRLRTSDKGD